ncbi:MAG: ABC transporter permease [Leptolyngbyaceae cyanobacterium SM1_1_3]|nr:ABC transporter permease [Leptolyngbyaceae cyanobacterium SM1_1_3]NJN01837.1 ABC transporter permease [Leptolyngbyaceae cyanobacterium RM1_1_2]NJO10650.1 ABC transporter permease [Leptolyngbyaceae cyanobacterium SL_1_1]
MSSTITPAKNRQDSETASAVDSFSSPELLQWKATAIAAEQALPGLFSGEFVQETLALTQRLFIQLQRRPSTLIAGIIQPLMWLILFGALFQNIPEGLFGESQNYGQFLGAGIIVFTAFAGALNAGLPVMFDREFGFLNRLLVAPLASRFSIVVASALFIAAMSFVQTASIVGVSAFLGAGLPSVSGLALMALIVFTLVLGVTALSLGLAFALPGHIELIAVIFVTNLPLLFSSTALVPISFMPRWLQVVASLNPLSYAIEPIRYLYLHERWSLDSPVLQAPWGSVSLGASLAVLVGFSAIALVLIQPLLRRRIA